MSRRIGSEPGQIGWWTWSTTFRIGSDRFGAPSDRRSVRSDTGCRSGCRYKLSGRRNWERGRRNWERGRRDRERGRRDNVSGRRDKIFGRRSSGRDQRNRECKKNDTEAEQSALEPKRMPSVAGSRPVVERREMFICPGRIRLLIQIGHIRICGNKPSVCRAARQMSMDN